MIITPHALVGAGVGAYINNLPVAFIIGFCSHFILDAIPHTDQGTLHDNEEHYQLNFRDYLILGFDFSITLVLLWWIIYFRSYESTSILIGSLGGITPDLIDNVPFWKYYLRKNKLFANLHKFHRKIHFLIKPKYMIWGVLIQLLIIGGTLCFLLG